MPFKSKAHVVPFVVEKKFLWWTRRVTRWRLTQDLVYEGNSQTFRIPAGFETDFASVPTAFQAIIPKRDPRYSEAAVLHDWLYASKEVSRKDADGIFRRVMREYGVPRWKRNSMYYAVRIFGGL